MDWLTHIREAQKLTGFKATPYFLNKEASITNQALKTTPPPVAMLWG
jgi:hypothetical protein